MKHTNKILTLILLLLSFCLLFSCSLREPTTKTQTTVSDSNTAPPESFDVSPEVEDAFNKALASIVMLDEKMTEQLKSDYRAQYGYSLSLNMFHAEPGDYLGGTFCYGNFSDCVVIFRSSMLTVSTTKTIAGEIFAYGSSFSILGYYEGVFYPLDEAYENGYITKEEVAIAAERHKTIRRYNTLRSLYEKAKAALRLPDEATSKSIENAFRNDNDIDIEWFNIDDKEHFTSAHLRSYGNFNGCIVLLQVLPQVKSNIKIIAGQSFESFYEINLWGYYKGTLYPLEKAYEYGHISQFDIGVAAARHKEVEQYIKTHGV